MEQTTKDKMKVVLFGLLVLALGVAGCTVTLNIQKNTSNSSLENKQESTITADSASIKTDVK